MHKPALTTRMAPVAEMSLTPGFLLGVQILQMSALELVAEIEAECARNELIVARPRERALGGDPTERHALLGQLPSRPVDLLEHIRREVSLLDLEPAVTAAVLSLAEQIDDRGYITESPERLVQLVGDSCLEEALAVLRSLPPGGLGATGPIDAMLAQLAPEDPDRTRLERILHRHLDELASGGHSRVAATLAVSSGELTRLLDRLRDLAPRPAEGFAPTAPQVRIPDLTVALDGGQLTVHVANEALPALRIDRRLLRLASASAMPADSRREIAGKLQRARAVIRAIDSRGATLERIATAVFARQLAFLRHGRAALRKLSMADVAAELRLHVSTVSRAVRHKMVATAHGWIALREFFLPGGARNGSADRDSMLSALRALLAADPRLSDEVLAQRLAESGLTVARRTVAKYRAELVGRRRPPRT
jgi:RNA polymerase sigma-54 factor